MVGVSAAALVWIPSEAVAAPEADIQIRADGSLRIDDVEYEGWSAYFTSPEFREHGARCGTDTSREAEHSTFAPSDCSLAQTVPSDDYAPAEPFVVPVVWHVIEASNGTGALSEERIASQMEILNEDFRAWSHGAGREGDDARIHFELARTDPDGRPTDGINRTRSDELFHDTAGGDMQRELAWDPERYLNIYTNNTTLDGDTPVLGYAMLPQHAAGQPIDGVVLHYSVVGRDAPDAYPYDQGRTATHEVGHYFGLLHPFDNGCGDPDEPYTTGDLIADTPPEDRPTFTCETFATGCDTFPSIDNYMSYTPDACMSRFTPEQILRMRCSAIHYRPRLIGDRTVPEARFAAEIDGRTVHFVDRSHDPGDALASWRWDFGDGETSSEQEPTHTYDESGTYDVTLVVADDLGIESARTSRVVANLPPVAAFTAQSDGTRVQFFDESYDLDGEIISWSWEFGDGETSSEKSPTHIYERPGVYTAVLVVRDDLGASAAASLDVEAAGVSGGCGCAAGSPPGPRAGAALLALMALVAIAALRRRRADCPLR